MKKMISNEVIIKRLCSRGYQAHLTQVSKNGVILYGVVIHNPANQHIAPCIYINDILEVDDDLERIVDRILKIYEKQKNFNFDISLLSNRSWVLEHTYIGLQRKTEDELIKKQCRFEDMEQYLYLRNEDFEEGWSIKLNETLLVICGIDENEVWDAGRKNTFSNNTKITRIGCYLNEVSSCAEFDGMDDMLPLYVVTNRTGHLGSIQILDSIAINAWMNTLPNKPKMLLCIPSSVHEWLVVPMTSAPSEKEIEFYNSMVQEVNKENVPLQYQLGTHVYFMAC